MSSYMRVWKMTPVHDVSLTILTSFSCQFPPNVSMSTYKRAGEPNISWSKKKWSHFSIKLIKRHIFKPKCNYRKKSMQEKESVMVVQFEMKFASLGITVRHHTASLLMSNSYPCDGIFNPTSWPLKILIRVQQKSNRSSGYFMITKG